MNEQWALTMSNHYNGRSSEEIAEAEKERRVLLLAQAEARGDKWDDAELEKEVKKTKRVSTYVKKNGTVVQGYNQGFGPNRQVQGLRVELVSGIYKKEAEAQEGPLQTTKDVHRQRRLQKRATQQRSHDFMQKYNKKKKI